MRLEEVTKPIPLALLGADGELVRQTQDLLTSHGYLDPPADGSFGPVSHWALAEFAKRRRIDPTAGLTPGLAAALLDTSHQDLPAVSANLPAPNAWFGRVIRYMQAREYWICRHPEAQNIVYLEGVDPDGTVNDDKPNIFNDLRIVFSIDGNGMPVLTSWEGTTEPGKVWTMTPQVSQGAARIAFDQYKSWVVGIHHPAETTAHEALVQVEPVLVYRDLNKDFSRKGDKTERGLFAINQHWGYDAPHDNLGNTSAGCLVGRTKNGHRQFMSMLKADPRYQANRAYRFMTAVMPGDQVLAG